MINNNPSRTRYELVKDTAHQIVPKRDWLAEEARKKQLRNDIDEFKRCKSPLIS